MPDLATISLDLPATNRYLNVLSACIAEMLSRVEERPPQETQIYELQLAAQEIGANIVDHAYPVNSDGRICIQLIYNPAVRQYTIVFTDTGQPYQEQGAPMLPGVEESANGGMGMFLVFSLVDDLNYQRLNDTNVWQMTKRLD